MGKFYEDWGLPGFIFVAFLILKLLNVGIVTNWSWWWVTSPLWIVIVFALLIGLLRE